MIRSRFLTIHVLRQNLTVKKAFYSYVSQFHQKTHKNWTCHTERSCHNIGLTYTKYSVNDSRRLVCEGERVILSRKSEQSDPVDAL